MDPDIRVHESLCREARARRGWESASRAESSEMDAASAASAAWRATFTAAISEIGLSHSDSTPAQAIEMIMLERTVASRKYNEFRAKLEHGGVHSPLSTLT